MFSFTNTKKGVKVKFSFEKAIIHGVIIGKMKTFVQVEVKSLDPDIRTEIYRVPYSELTV